MFRSELAPSWSRFSPGLVLQWNHTSVLLTLQAFASREMIVITQIHQGWANYFNKNSNCHEPQPKFWTLSPTSFFFFFKANMISISTSLKLIMWTLQSWPSLLIQLLSSNLTISNASLGLEGVSTFWGIPLTWGMHGMGRHQPAEPRRKCAKTETPLIKYSLERGALGSQREGAALGAGRGMRRG